MKTIAVCNQKGGVGKTAISINLAAALAQQDTVLLVDFDPQGHATEGVGAKDLYTKDSPSLYDGLLHPKTKVDDLVHEVPNERFYLIPSHFEMMLAEQALNPVRGREFRLRSLLDGLGDAFEWVILDCPPNLGILTDNAIYAARRLVIPVQAEQTSMRALDLLFDQIDSIEEGLQVKTQIVAVVPNLVQDSGLSKRILADLHSIAPDATPFEIRKRVVLQEAYEKGHSIFTYEGDRTKASAIAELRGLFTQLADIVRERSK